MTKNIGDGRIANENVMIGMTYLGEETLSMDSSSVPATLPEGTNFVEVSASGGAVQYSINGDASANSGGYCPQDQTRYILKLDNLTSLEFYGASPAKTHLIYKQEQ